MPDRCTDPSCEQHWPPARVRAHVGWLIWCMTEGYVKAEDRAILDNWLLYGDETLSAEDRDTKAGLLTMADEVLTQIGNTNRHDCKARGCIR